MDAGKWRDVVVLFNCLVFGMSLYISRVEMAAGRAGWAIFWIIAAWWCAVDAAKESAKGVTR